MPRRSTECPAPDCGFSDVPSLVAAHVNGSEGAEHDWARLPYDGPGEFLSAARSGAASEADEATDGVDEATDGVDEATDCADDGSNGAEPNPDAADHTIDPAPVFRAVDVVRDRAETAEDGDLAALETSELVDLFVACSVLASEAGSVRSDVRAAIIDRVDEEGELEGTLGAVDRSRSTRRSLRDEGTVRSALFRAGIDPREAESFDPTLVRELVEAARADDPAGTPIDESDVFETSESDHVRRASVNEEAFRDR